MQFLWFYWTSHRQFLGSGTKNENLPTIVCMHVLLCLHFTWVEMIHYSFSAMRTVQPFFFNLYNPWAYYEHKTEAHKDWAVPSEILGLFTELPWILRPTAMRSAKHFCIDPRWVSHKEKSPWIFQRVKWPWAIYHSNGTDIVSREMAELVMNGVCC